MTGVHLTPLVQNAHFFAGRRRVKIKLKTLYFYNLFYQVYAVGINTFGQETSLDELRENREH